MGNKKYRISQKLCFIALLILLQAGKAQNREDGASQFIFDAHVHVGFAKHEGRITISGSSYFTDHHINAFVFALPVDRSETDNLLLRITEEIELIHYLAKKNRSLILLNGSDSLNFQSNNSKPSMLFGIEFFDGIFGKNPESILSYKELGVCYITLINNTRDNLFSLASKLTEFGASIIKMMNEVNMLIDISHLTDKQMLEVIQISKKPVVASHSAAKAFVKTESNLSDAVLDALKSNSGYVMVTFNKIDLFGKGKKQSDGVEQVVRHLDHIKKFVGISHIGIGSDYQAAGKYIAEELNKIDVYARIIEIMKTHGYSESEISGVLGNNFKRLLN